MIMHRFVRHVLGLVVVALALASCSSSAPTAASAPVTDDAPATDDAATDPTAPNDEAASGEGDGATAPDDSDAEDDADPDTDAASAAELPFRPTDSREPFSTDGGAISSDDSVRIEAESPTAALNPGVRGITAGWPTDWARQTVDLGMLAAGLQYNDPRDGIPPIDEPRFEPTTAAENWLDATEPGAVVVIDDDARFYPLAIMTRHEIVNDRFGDLPIAVTYCPLCNSAVAFDRRVDGEVLRFGVSGLLRNSDLVMWDDASTSLWQQLTGEGIVGRFAGTMLEPVSSRIMSFGQFSEAYPDGWSLGPDQGFGSTYGSNPYVGYSSRSEPIGAFFSGTPDDRLPALERVVGVRTTEGNKAFPFSALSEVGVVNDLVGETEVAIFWGAGTTDALDDGSIAQSRDIGTGVAYDRIVDGELLTFERAADGFRDVETGTTWSIAGLGLDGPLAGSSLVALDQRNDFWFAWAAFYPDAALFS